MNIEFRQLSINDGIDIYDMLQDIPKDENGFVNGCNGKTFDDYKKWLLKSDAVSKGIGLESWMVPQNIYWLYIDNIPVGMGKLRHSLTDKLREEGGHGGYAIRPAYRNMGYGKLLMQLLIQQAKKLKIDRLLITVHNHNIPSIKVAVSNGGKVDKVDGQRHYIWIDVNRSYTKR